MKGMTVIVKVIAKFVSPLVVLFGIYVILHGHLTPGGGFPGGVILASAFILLTLAYGKEEVFKRLKERTSYLMESSGALIFLGLALLGILLGGRFFLNFLPPGKLLSILSGGFIPLCNIGIGIKVGGGILGVFLALVIFRLKRRSE